MARHQSSGNTLRNPNSTVYSSMVHPNSTSNLDSPSLYPLYSEPPTRPYTSLAQQHAVASRPRRKNMREMIGTTTEDEFDTLPLAVRRKVRTLFSDRMNSKMACNCAIQSTRKMFKLLEACIFSMKMRTTAETGPLFSAIDELRSSESRNAAVPQMAVKLCSFPPNPQALWSHAGPPLQRWLHSRTVPADIPPFQPSPLLPIPVQLFILS
jgi:hypothetical protein